jgi:predicted lipoprotein with Yx(FWY)xxD motif
VRTRVTRYLVPLCILLVAGAVAAVAASGSGKATVKVETSKAVDATILVNAGGFTLYHYLTDGKNKVTCTAACKGVWPPLLVTGSAKPIAGPGVKQSMLGTIKRPDGGTQVTYDGFALYRYVGDKEPGNVNGQGTEKKWYVLGPTGALVKTAATGASGGSSSTGSTSSTGGNGGAGDNGGAGGAAGCTPGVIVNTPGDPCYNY